MRTQTFIERVEIEADSEGQAEEFANEMLDEEDVDFEVESNCEDGILEIVEILDDEGDDE